MAPKKNHPHENLNDILHNRVDLYRKTDINKGLKTGVTPDFLHPDWLYLKHHLNELWLRHQHDMNSSAFEANAFELLQPTVDARSLRDYQECPPFEHFQCGSLKYDRPQDNNPKCVFIHIGNAISPRSIFAPQDYLKNSLRELMDLAEKEYGATKLCTETWINSHPKWLTLFPAQWHTNMAPADHDIGWHYGYWGQFITAKGTFNHVLGKKFRETAVFPFGMRYS